MGADTLLCKQVGKVSESASTLKNFFQTKYVQVQIWLARMDSTSINTLITSSGLLAISGTVTSSVMATMKLKLPLSAHELSGLATNGSFILQCFGVFRVYVKFRAPGTFDDNCNIEGELAGPQIVLKYHVIYLTGPHASSSSYSSCGWFSGQKFFSLIL